MFKKIFGAVQRNVLGGKLKMCGANTGWFRDGCCKTDEMDKGLHTVCVIVNK